jgi:hypothetical protein
VGLSHSREKISWKLRQKKEYIPLFPPDVTENVDTKSAKFAPQRVCMYLLTTSDRYLVALIQLSWKALALPLGHSTHTWRQHYCLVATTLWLPALQFGVNNTVWRQPYFWRQEYCLTPVLLFGVSTILFGANTTVLPLHYCLAPPLYSLASAILFAPAL